MVWVDEQGLSAAGARLARTSQTYVPAVALAPGVDMTSVSAAQHLNAVSAGLVARLNHANVLRELGGQAVINTATMLASQDDDNAAAIANASITTDAVGGLMSVPHVPAPPVPDIPQIPAALAPLPGEAHSRALYGGPGSSSVYQFAQQWSRHGDQLSTLADTLNNTAEAIDQHWDRGQQQAGANTVRHASWVAEMSQHARSLAGYARIVAESFDRAKADTPSPEEFGQTRTKLTNAMQHYAATKGANATEVQQLTQQYADQQAQATHAVTGYHGQITTASIHTDTTGKDAPPIAGGGKDSPPPARPLDSTKWKPGDKRHMPYIAGRGGVGPPNPPDAPPWIEIGQYSGNWVRSDELPGVKVMEPNGIRPAPVHDEHGNEIAYIELGPHTGVWAPQSDFPGAKIYPPGSDALPPYGYDEWIPGSGIYLWHGDMVPEPYNPRAPLVPPQTFPQ